MKIAVFHDLPSGGAKRAVMEWVKRLSQRHTVDAYSLSTADHSFCDLRPYTRRHEVAEFAPHRLWRSPWGRLNQMQRWRDLGALERIGNGLAEQINRSGYDILFANPSQWTLIPPFMEHVQIPSAYYLHEPILPGQTPPPSRPYWEENTWSHRLNRMDPLIKLYWRRLSQLRERNLRAISLLIANSRFTQDRMRVAYGLETQLCYYGVNLVDFHPRPDVARESHLLSVGELTPRKGFDFLVTALAHLSPARRPPLRIVANWVSPPERRFVEQLAADHGVTLQVLEALNTQALAVEYNKALLCVYAPVAEPLGLVPLEAMACATPVVGVAEGGVRETVVHGQTGLLVARNARAFASAVDDLLSDAERRVHMGMRGQRYVSETWTWDASTQKLETLFASITG